MDRYPSIQASIAKLEEEGFPIYAFDASLGGKYPVICVVLLNPNNGTCFASFGAHPNFQVALERTVTELLQGRSLKISMYSHLHHSITMMWRSTRTLKHTLLILVV